MAEAGAATRLRRDAADNHRRLLEAALAEFNEQGMDACVEQIAARAGVGIGTFYRRFGTKDALVEQMVDDLLDELADAADRYLAADGADGLELFLREIATALSGRRGFLPRLWSSTSLEHVQQLRPRVRALLRMAQDKGAIREDVTGNDISVLMWSLRSIIEIIGDAAGPACQRHLDICLAGMRPDSEPLRHPPLSDRARSRAEHRVPGRH
jgi:AcrR family transcriptional regulator